MKENHKNSKWHVLYRKPRHEVKALERLAQNGFEVYRPMKKTEKKRAIPLTVPSVLNYIFWLGKPVIIRDTEIDTLKGIISKDKAQEFEVRELKIGDEIDINKGKIKAKKAIIKSISNNIIKAELVN